MFVFLGQWCMTLLSHPADCLLGLHAYTWTTMIPSATQSTFTALQWLSNNNTTQCLTHTRAHTHMLTPVCHRPNQFHQCSLAQMFLELKWQDPQRRSNKCLLTLLLSSFHFISFGVPTALHAIMEVTNYSPCNFIVQCTNKQHNPPFITWNRIFKTQLNVGRELSKAKPDVVRRVFVQAKPWGMLSSGEFVRECVCARVCGGEKGSEGRGVHYWDGTTRRATAVVRSYGKLGEALCSQVGGRGSRVYVLWGWGQRQGRWGWDWSYSRGRYCVARLTVRVHEVSQLRWPLTPKPAPQPNRSRMRLKNNATHLAEVTTSVLFEACLF